MNIWDEKRVSLLTLLVREGWSSSQIGEKLRITRNAVIGKAHRLGLNLSQIAENLGVKKPRPQKRAKPKPYHPLILESSILQSQPYNEPVVTAPPEPVEAGPITLMDLQRGMCKWPINEGYPQFYFCGQPCDTPPYCPEHFRRAYGKPKPMEKMT